MENLALYWYLIGLINPLTATCALVVSVCMLVGFFYVGVNYVDNHGKWKETSNPFKFYKVLSVICIIPILLFIFVPSTQTAKELIAINIGVEVLQHERTSELADKSLIVMENILDKYIKETEETK